MKVLFLRDYASYGRIGQIKEVADGYALNFLLPKKIVCRADKHVLNTITQKETAKKERALKKEKINARLEKKLSGLNIGLRGKADEHGKLFASITPEMIATRLRRKGIIIPKQKIRLKCRIKHVGTYTVEILYAAGKKQTITLVVQAD